MNGVASLSVPGYIFSLVASIEPLPSLCCRCHSVKTIYTNICCCWSFIIHITL